MSCSINNNADSTIKSFRRGGLIRRPPVYNKSTDCDTEKPRPTLSRLSLQHDDLSARSLPVVRPDQPYASKLRPPCLAACTEHKQYELEREKKKK